jgi:CO dehydrogenase nickel-insertion accessory protein CooC1
MARQFKKNKIVQILENDADVSNIDIAKKLGCAKSYVSMIRGQWAKQQEPQQQPKSQLYNMPLSVRRLERAASTFEYSPR